MNPRVFVSSVIDGFKKYRDAARRGIKKSGGDPVLIEDYPGLPVSPRNACLDAVGSSDIFIIIIGERGGWTAPSAPRGRVYSVPRMNKVRLIQCCTEDGGRPSETDFQE